VSKLRFGVVLVALLLAGDACNQKAADVNPRVDRAVITRDQILEHRFTTVHDAVQALRSNWLNTRGTDSFTNPGEVQVYLDNVHLGGMATLRGIAASTVQSIRFIDGIAATARWGIGHGHGVIFINTSS
jgi:hypothetical protein